MSIEGCRHSNNEQHHYHSNIYSFQYEMLHIQHTLKKHVIKILSLYRNVTCCLDTMMGVLSCCNNRTIWKVNVLHNSLHTERKDMQDEMLVQSSASSFG